MFKVSRGLSSEIDNELFKFREQIPYELRRQKFSVSNPVGSFSF